MNWERPKYTSKRRQRFSCRLKKRETDVYIKYRIERVERPQNVSSFFWLIRLDCSVQPSLFV
jgi:hypothetical protein